MYSGKRTMVIVHEDAIAAEHLVRPLLQDFNVSVCAADETSGVLELIDQRPVDVVVASQGLQDGRGLSLLRSISGTNPEVLRILLLSRMDQEDQAHLDDAITKGTIHQYLVHPVRNTLFALTLKEMLQARPAGASKPGKGRLSAERTQAGVPGNGRIAQTIARQEGILELRETISKLPKVERPEPISDRKALQELQELIQQHKEQMAGMEDARSAAEQERDRFATRCGEIQRELEDQKRRFAALSSENQELNMENGLLTKQNSLLTYENRKLQEDLQKLKEERVVFERELVDLDALRKELELIKGQSGVVQGIRVEYERLAHQNAQLVKENGLLETRVLQIRQELETLQNGMAGLIREVKKEFAELQDVARMRRGGGSFAMPEPMQADQVYYRPPSSESRPLQTTETGRKDEMDRLLNTFESTQELFKKELRERADHSSDMRSRVDALKSSCIELEKEKEELIDRLIWMRKMWSK